MFAVVGIIAVLVAGAIIIINEKTEETSSSPHVEVTVQQPENTSKK